MMKVGALLSRGLVLAALAAWFLGGHPVGATPIADFDWQGPSGGTWDTATNWNPNGVPGAGDTVAFGVAGVGVSLNAGARAANSVALANAAGSYVITSGGAGGSLAVGAGGLSQTGNTSNEVAARLIGSSGSTWAVSAGTLRLSDITNTAPADLTASVSGGKLVVLGSAAQSSLGSAAVTLSSGTLSFQGSGAGAEVGGVQGRYWQNSAVPNNTFPASVYSDTLGYYNGLPAPTVTQQLSQTIGINFSNSGYGGGNPFSPIGVNVGTDNITARWIGILRVNTPGSYAFQTISDDGSLVWVDGVRVVDNNGSHGQQTRTGSITLAAGDHVIDVPFCEGGGGAGIVAQYTAPGGAQTYVGIDDTGGRASFVYGPFTLGLANPIGVTGNSTIEVGIAFGISQLGPLSVSNGVTLTTQGLPMSFAQTTLSGTATLNALVDTTAGRILAGAPITSLTMAGSARLILDHTAAASGFTSSSTVNVTAGRLIAVASGAIDPLDNATIALSGGALSLSSKGGTVTFDNALTVNNSATLTAQQIASGVANGTIVLGSAARGVTVAGGQTLTLATADGYWLQLAGPMGGGGAVTLPGGAQVRLSHAGGLSVGGAVNVQNGAVLESSVAAPNLSQVNVNGGGILRLSTDPSGGIVPTPAVSGIVEANTDVGAAFDNLTFNGGSTLRATGATRTYAGDLRLQGGQVDFGGAGQNLLLTGAVANGGSAGGINVVGGNTLTLSGPLSYTGTTNVNSGTLVLNSVLASPTVNVTGGSTLSIGAGGGLTSANVTVTNGTLRTTAPASLGNGPLTVNSAGQIQFSQGTGNTVTYSGTTINVNNGTLYAQSGITDLGGATIAVVPLITQAGLVEGRLGTGAFDETSPNPGGAVQFYPRMGETSSKPPWGDNETWVYTGQVYVTGTGVISFAENIDDNCKVVIDGVQRLRDTNWNTPTTTGIVSLTPNAWHDIEIRMGNGGGGAGPVAGNGWTSTYGFGYNPAGSTSNQGTAYVVPQDNGSGNLFRTVTGGGTLRVDAGATLRAGAFTSATNVNLNGAAGNPAILRLADHASPTNSTATNLSLLGTNPLGTLDLGANNVLTVNNLSVAPGGTLTEQGAGTLVVSDALSLAAGSLLSVSGRVLVNGVGSGPGGVVVNSGGVLGGTGSIFGPTTVNNLGTLAPGAGQGILHTHDVAFSPGSIFQVELFGPAPGTGYDQLDVIGGVNLGDATLDLQLNYTPILMSSFTIVNNDGVDPIVGSFLGLPEGSLLMRTYAGTNWLFDVTYRGGDGNDVVLTGYTPEPATLTLVALGGLMLLRRRRK